MSRDVIIWNHPDTGLACVTQPAYDDRTRPIGLSDDEFRAFSVVQSLPAGVVYWEVPRSEIPSSREFRHLWRVIDGVIVPTPGSP